jgi:hypothetical protein
MSTQTRGRHARPRAGRKILRTAAGVLASLAALGVIAVTAQAQPCQMTAQRVPVVHCPAGSDQGHGRCIGS